MQALRSRCRALMQERDASQQDCSQLQRRIARMDRDLEQTGAPLVSTSVVRTKALIDSIFLTLSVPLRYSLHLCFFASRLIVGRPYPGGTYIVTVGRTNEAGPVTTWWTDKLPS